MALSREIGQGLPEALPIPGQVKLWRVIGLKRDLLILGHITIEFDDAGQDFRQIHPLQV